MELMRTLDPKAVRFLFVALSGRPGSFDEEIRKLGGDVLYLPLNWKFPFLFVQLIRRKPNLIVHSHVATFSGVILRSPASAVRESESLTFAVMVTSTTAPRRCSEP